MKIDSLMKRTILNEMIEKKFVSEQDHPEAKYSILNYTHKAQYDREWNEVTKQCRGLIYNNVTGDVVARPFPKFFNIGEEDVDLPAEGFEVTEKMDGSLGVLYWYANEPHIATRGSFESTQARRGTQMIQDMGKWKRWDRDKTYLFEIIFPENRIVVDYGKEESLVLLAVIDTETGKDLPLPDWYSPRVKRYDGIKDVHQLKERQEDNREGFVIRFNSGQRFKVKFDEYVRLHRIVTGINARHIWEYLRDNKSLDEILDKVPDEFYQWVKETERGLYDHYNRIDYFCKRDFEDLQHNKDDRKAFASDAIARQYPSILFKMLDERPYEELIWKEIKPEAEVPFKEDIDA